MAAIWSLWAGGQGLPAIGPWFNTALIELPTPETSLAVRFTVPPLANLPDDDEQHGYHWMPPATGWLSLYVIDASRRHRDLARLRGTDGGQPFADGSLVVTFRLLAEVEEEMHRLSRTIPAVDASFGSRNAEITASAAWNDPPTRERVRWFCLELDPGWTASDVAALFVDVLDLPASGDGWELLGLRLEGGKLVNRERSMRLLARPGELPVGWLLPDTVPPLADKLCKLQPETSYRLWCFDARGRPVEPGAVAEWWLYIDDVGLPGPLGGLFARGVDSRTCPVDPTHTVHFVNPHGGPVDPRLLERVDEDAAGLLRVGDTPVGFRIVNQDVKIRMQETDPDDPPVNAFPDPLAVILPGGLAHNEHDFDYWPGKAIDPSDDFPILHRDFVRVALLSPERFLTGIERGDAVPAQYADDPPPGVDPVGFHRDALRARRRALQNAPFCKPRVVRMPRGLTPLCPDLDSAALALLDALRVPAGAGAPPPGAYLVTPQLDRGWGAATSTAPAAVAVADPPDRLVGLETAAIVGAGTETGGLVQDQRMLLRVRLAAGLVGAWVRAWALGFDPSTGLAYARDGAGAPALAVGSEAVAALALPLPAGSSSLFDSVRVTVAVTTSDGGTPPQLRTAWFPAQRLERPDLAGGSPVPWNPGSGQILEDPAGGQLAAGMVAVDLADPPTLVTPGSAPWHPDTFPPLARPGLEVLTTARAHDSLPAGSDAAALAPAVLSERTRDANPFEAGYLPRRLQRKEVVAVLQPTINNWPPPFPPPIPPPPDPLAALGAAPCLTRYREGLPHHHGMPFAPGGVDAHGTGLRLNREGVMLAWEIAMDRRHADLDDLANGALALAPADVSEDWDAPVVWASLLRTTAGGFESFLGTGLVTGALGAAYLFPLDLAGLGVLGALATLAGGSAPNSLTRLVGRRLSLGAWGATEGLDALESAIDRAEDLLYIETPALDALDVDPTRGGRNLVERIRDRMLARPGLQLVLVVARFLVPGAPEQEQRVRDGLLHAALRRLREEEAGPRPPWAVGLAERVAVLFPAAGAGRSLRILSTTVVVDDSFVLTGTTHLSRRGLSFDSSVAGVVWDEQHEDGRSQQVRDFRRRLCADRLGVPQDRVPRDPERLVAMMRKLAQSPSSKIVPPPPDPGEDATPAGDDAGTVTEADIWNPDGVPAIGTKVLESWVLTVPDAQAADPAVRP